MNRYFTSPLLAILIFFFFYSCTTKKKYYYSDERTDEKVIEEISDSAAYIVAYRNYIISKKIYNDFKKSYGKVHFNQPKGFTLLNDKRQNITFSISFKYKDRFEKSIEKGIYELPNISKNDQ